MSEREHLEQAIAHLEAQRAALGDTVVDTILEPLRRQLAELGAAERESLPALQGERKLVTIMFADISGFTALAEIIDPETVRELMNACFDYLVPVIERYGGTVDKFIGDEIMALFGAPTTQENDPERALRAALEMMEALAAFNAEHNTDLDMHIGVNTGLVVAGAIGAPGRQEYSVIGDAVNVASRLGEASERGEVLVGPDTYRLTAPLFEFDMLDPIQVKGKAEPIPAYRLLAARAIPGKVRGIAGLESPLVGREADFAVLQEAIKRLQAGQGGVVTLVGEAGLGKSRLVAELRKEAQGQLPQWVEGRCLSYGSSIAYMLWLDILRGLLGVSLEDAPLAVRGALRRRVQILCPGRFDAVYPYLSWMLLLPSEAESEALRQDLEGEQLKAAAFQATEILLESTAQQNPLVIVCEDLHWADPTSIDLLEHLLALANRVPLLFICVFRPTREHPCWRIREAANLPHRHRHTDLWLTPLSADESATLVGNLLRVEDLSQELRELILSHAEGNPFYVEEIIRSLIDSEAITHDEATGRWQATRDVAEIAIPDTLHGVLMARIDRLREETKRILQLASVIGRIFLYRVLAEIAREEQELDAHLGTLQKEEMIRERAHIPELEYIFKHQLTQEAAYNGLLKSDRRTFHRYVAETLERLFPDRIEEQVGLLAFHWERAEIVDKATEYLLRAGDRARQAYAHQEAIDYYQRALAFLKQNREHGRAARTLMKLGLTYHTAFDFQQSRQAYEEGFALWQQAGEVPEGTAAPAPHPLRAHWENPLTLDPAMPNESNSLAVICQLFSGLVELSAGMNVLPDVARSWELLEGGDKFIFHLREDVRWSDGTPLTAADFEYAWKRVLDPSAGSQNATLLYDIQGARPFHQGKISDPGIVGVRALDEVTLAVDLEGPRGYFLHLLTYSAFYPVPRHVVEAHGQAWAEAGRIVTNGPFLLDTWQQNQTIVLSRNPAYHGRFGGNLERVELSLRTLDAAAKLELFGAADLDVLYLFGFPRAEVDRIRQAHAGVCISYPNLLAEYLGFNVGCPPFDDRRVRQAFALTIDQETLANVVLRGYVSPASGGFVPPGMPGHSAGIGLPYDPERARQLLAEAGYPGGRGFPRLEGLVVSGADMELYAEYLREQWQKHLGIELAWRAIEFGPYVDKLRKEAPPLFPMAWIPDYPDPDSFLRMGFRWEGVEWHDEAYEELVEKARRITDQEERLKLYRQADKILVEEAVIAPLFYGQAYLLVKPWLRKYPTPGIGWFHWKDVIIEPH